MAAEKRLARAEERVEAAVVTAMRDWLAAVRVLILAEVEGDRQLAIWMSAAGAAGILGALQDPDPDHPSSHELMLALVHSLGGEVSVAHIVGHQEGVFYAELIVDGRPVNARPSDAIAVAMILVLVFRPAGLLAGREIMLPARWVAGRGTSQD